MLTNIQEGRVSAYALNRLTQEMGLSNLAIKFNGDDRNDILPVGDGYVKALHNGHKVAQLFVREAEGEVVVSIIVNNCYDLIRDEHYSLFTPSDYGIQYNRGKSPITGDKFDDLVVVDWILDKPIIDMGGTIIPFKNTQSERFKVTSSLGVVTYH